MALRKMLDRLRTPTQELDRARLREFSAGRADAIAIAEVKVRESVTVVGEIRSLRIVPRAGSPSLEATINDGTGSIVAVWTGRRRIGGITPGRRLAVTGRAAPVEGTTRLILLNPIYELIAAG